MDVNMINKLLDITESYQAPAKMLEILLEKEEREKLFQEFLKHEKDLSYEWFKNYFENEHSDRKVKKQDFTPNAVAEIMTRIVNAQNDSVFYEIAAGTGTIAIEQWNRRKDKTDPKIYWYQVEELSDRAIPFLIFNMAIRGMNGVVLHGDSLSREFKEVYFIRNQSDDYYKFSEIFIMPKTDQLKKELSINKWS